MSEDKELLKENKDKKPQSKVKVLFLIFCCLFSVLGGAWSVSYDFREWLVCSTVLSHKNNCKGDRNSFTPKRWNDGGDEYEKGRKWP